MSDHGDPRGIGFIGLGNMGGPMAARLVDAGHQVRGYDPDPTARARLAANGGEPVDSGAAAAEGADLVITMLPSSAVVRAVVTDDAFAHALGPGALVVDMSSSEPAVNQELAEWLARWDARMIDAPVSGGVSGAEAGDLSIMVGGDPADVSEAGQVLEVLGRVFHAGPIGAGDAVKALNNLLSATHLWATSEVMAAGVRFGLDPDVMLSIFNSSSGRSGSTEAKWPKFVRTGRYDSGFTLRLMLKDMRIATDLCGQTGVSARLGQCAVELWQDAADGLAHDADHTEVARWVEDPGVGLVTESS